MSRTPASRDDRRRRRRALGHRHGRHRPRDPRVAGGRRSGRCCFIGGRRRRRWRLLAWWLVSRKREGQADPDRSGALPSRRCSGSGISGQTASADRAGRHDDRRCRSTSRWSSSTTRCEAGLSLAPLSLSMFAVAHPRRQAGRATVRPSNDHPGWFRAADRRRRRRCIAARPARRPRAGGWRSR